jgi:carbamoyltransferase
MNILGYSGLDASIRYARRDPHLRPGEERMVQGLDSAAAIIIDGVIVAAAAEERFCEEKHTNAFPAESIRYCLDAAGITAGQIDAVAHGFDYGRYRAMFRAVDAERYETVLSPAGQLELWQDRFGLRLPAEKFVPVLHHVAHGASAYFPSGFTDALCVVCDGMGETEALSVYAVRDGAFELLDRHRISDSLGILYGLVTVHLGFKFNADEYKVMGLAPYGRAEVFRGVFDGILELLPDGKYAIRWDRLIRDQGPHYRSVLAYLHDQVIARPDNAEILPQPHCDLAAAVQECVEKALFHVIEYWRERTGLSRVCMAGGVALNCTFNGKLAQRRLFDEIYVQPAAGDDGTALGAALAVAHRRGEALSPTMVCALPFYGPGYSTEEVLSVTRRLAAGLDVVDLGSAAAAAEDAAAALAQDQIVAWFQDRMEYGPRALGNRSILANPLIPDIKERLNLIIKLREGFRPFAPAVTIERAQEYFDFLPSSMFDYMLATCPVRPEWRDRLPGVTHVDGSARMQTVDPLRNPLFHKLITSFGQRTGVHCVVNTSFNLSGQPMIVSPAIAVETFLKARLDRLYLGSVRLCKRT